MRCQIVRQISCLYSVLKFIFFSDDENFENLKNLIEMSATKYMCICSKYVVAAVVGGVVGVGVVVGAVVGVVVGVVADAATPRSIDITYHNCH